jgi:hypothetical protein
MNGLFGQPKLLSTRSWRQNGAVNDRKRRGCLLTVIFLHSSYMEDSFEESDGDGQDLARHLSEALNVIIIKTLNSFFKLLPTFNSFLCDNRCKIRSIPQILLSLR